MAAPISDLALIDRIIDRGTVTARGYALSASPGSTSTQQFSRQKVFMG